MAEPCGGSIFDAAPVIHPEVEAGHVDGYCALRPDAVHCACWWFHVHEGCGCCACGFLTSGNILRGHLESGGES